MKQSEISAIANAMKTWHFKSQNSVSYFDLTTLVGEVREALKELGVPEELLDKLINEAL